jgi:hypothetical protein
MSQESEAYTKSHFPKRKHMSKHKQIYGYSSSESSDEKPANFNGLPSLDARLETTHQTFQKCDEIKGQATTEINVRFADENLVGEGL